MPCFLVMGDRCWGRGETPEEAASKAAKELSKKSIKSHRVFLVDPSTVVDEMGSFSYSFFGEPPIELYRVIEGKQCPVGRREANAAVNP